MTLIRPGMGTENTLDMLASLIQFIKPTLVLEVGAGDSTLAIIGALKKAVMIHEQDQHHLNGSEWSERVELLRPSFFQKAYHPTFMSIDNISAQGSSALKAWDMIQNQNNDALTFKTIQDDFFNLPPTFFNHSFNFIWLNAGTLADDVRFLEKLWPRLADGGIVCLHEPYMTTTILHEDEQELAMVRTPLWEKIVHDFRHVDILSLPELHKCRQSGLGILRKRLPWEKPRALSFQEEMLILKEPPVRFCLDSEQPQEPRWSILKNHDTRRVFHAVGSGFHTLQDIALQTNMTRQSVAKHISKLIQHQFVIDNKGYYENKNLWNTYSPPPASNRVLSDSDIEKPAVLSLIAGHLSFDTDYTEAYINEYCRCFTPDYARLRRKLIDDGYFTRENGIYKRHTS